MDNSSPLQPQNPSASSPPPTPAAPSVQLPVPSDDEVLNSLSPFEVMKKKQSYPVPPPAPVSVSMPLSQADAAPTREQLIEQATKASTGPFILPTAPSSPSVDIHINTVPQQIPAAPISVPVIPVPIPPVPQPQILPLQRPVVAPLVSSKIPTTGTNSSVPRRAVKKSKTGLFTLLGVLVVLLLIGGGGYVLASTGSRLPFIYTYISGLPSNGKDMAQEAGATLATEKSYQQYGKITLKAQGEDGAILLPSEVGTTDPVTSFTTNITANAPLMYSIADKKLSGQKGLVLDNLSEVPVYILGTEGGEYHFNLPANVVEPIVGISSTELRGTIAYSVLQPIPLPILLQSVTGETGYQKVSGEKVAQYTYTLSPDTLKEFIPINATIKDAKAEISYAWKTKLPVSSKITGIITYLDRSYQLSETFSYGNFGKDLDVTDTELATLESSKESIEIVPADTFIPQLGVPFVRIPNTIIDSSLLSDTDPVTPSGQSTNEILSNITGVPPLPVSPASEEAKSRDVQRLSDLKDLQKALQKYKLRQGQYPQVSGLEQVQASQTLLDDLVDSYITGLPIDPLSDTYWYEYKSDGRTYILRSVVEDTTNPEALPGKAFYYYELTGK